MCNNNERTSLRRHPVSLADTPGALNVFDGDTFKATDVPGAWPTLSDSDNDSGAARAQATAFGSRYIPITTLVPTLADAIRPYVLAV